MYAKCGALSKAQQVLDKLLVQDVVAWSALTAGYVEQGQYHEALECYEVMQKKGFFPSAVTFTCILRACGHLTAVAKGQEVHDKIAHKGLMGKDIMLDNGLISMYVKCGMLDKARQVLEEIPVRDVFSWSALIAGYTQQGFGDEALKCFELMQHEGLTPNAVTFTLLIRACGSIGAADKGEQIHKEVANRGLLEDDLLLVTALVDMYAKCGELSKAYEVLQEASSSDVVSWSALISGYAQQGKGEEALKCFEQMQNKGLSPNSVTYSCVLKACGCIGALEKGEQIHQEIAQQGLLEKDIILGNALVNMYLKCHAYAKAEAVRNKLPAGDVVSWSSLIAGYVQQGKGEKALKCFAQMQDIGILPDSVTFICVLQACSILGAVDKGEQIHNKIAKEGLHRSDSAVGNALVDMYVKFGALAKARQLLDELPIQDVVVWSALISGYAQHGQGQAALECFEFMEYKGLNPDPFTMASVLNACSHSGLIEEGQIYFLYLNTKYGTLPNVEHYTCMVDLFGRAGLFEKAIALIQDMPSLDYLLVWSALLGACQRWGDVNLGKWAFNHAVQMDKSYASMYVCMANMYTAAGMEEDAKMTENNFGMAV
ncbi:hypothetical protein KP509_27G064300 [Ceratopteris richardii]|nr:hypothetical protein KP509_27G064300 [Ceratopteris richardii]